MDIGTERAKNITSVVQSVVLTAAVLVGGIWTWRTFDITLQKENAEAELLQARRALTEEIKLQVKLKVVDQRVVDKTRVHVVGELLAENRGSKNALFQFEDKPVHVFRVAFDDKGSPRWIPVAQVDIPVADRQHVGNLEIRAGSSSAIPFAFSIPNAAGSLHAIRVASLRPVSDLPQAPDAQASGSGLGKVYWGQVAYFWLGNQ